MRIGPHGPRSHAVAVGCFVRTPGQTGRESSLIGFRVCKAAMGYVYVFYMIYGETRIHVPFSPSTFTFILHPFNEPRVDVYFIDSLSTVFGCR